MKHSACNQQGDVFPATVILSALNHLTVTRAGNVGASLESQGRSVTAVPTDISTSKKEAAQVCTKGPSPEYSCPACGALPSVGVHFASGKAQERVHRYFK